MTDPHSHIPILDHPIAWVEGKPNITVEAGFKASVIDTEDKAESILQPIVDTAYELYEANDSWSFGEFLMHLDVKQRNVVAIGKLNQQVCNGGFMQWRDNGYDEKPEFLFQALKAVGTDAAKKVLDLVEQVLGVDTEVDDEDEDPDYEYDIIQQAFEPYDDKFDKVNEKLLCDLATWWLHEECEQVLGS